jgi:hypothetical protein
MPPMLLMTFNQGNLVFSVCTDTEWRPNDGFVLVDNHHAGSIDVEYYRIFKLGGKKYQLITSDYKLARSMLL